MAIVVLCGCAGMADSVSEYLHAGPWWAAAQTVDIRARARALETQGELAMALDHWRWVDRITIKQAESNPETARLEAKIAAAVQLHYQDGLAELSKKNLPAARNHFLAALRLDPTFEPAMQQVKTRFSPFPLTVYLSAPGDHPAFVANKIFGDEEKAFLVAWFNDLPEDAGLTPGTLLILPKLEKTPSRTVIKKQPPNHLAEARARLAENDLDGALTLAGQADQADQAAQSLIHTIYLKKATTQIESGLPDAARQSLAMVPDGFADKDATLKALRTALHAQQATLRLEKARAHFDQGHYQQSLDLTETLLQDAPESVAARNLAAEARYRLALDHFDHNRFIEVRKVLEKADRGHAASMALQETVRIRLVELAQNHYRNGVKHFINEDLQSAIAEWEMALICNPQHAKARENIDNARRLIQKIETLP
jgi:tetratricopeptide (TPR) repeat protein